MRIELTATGVRYESKAGWQFLNAKELTQLVQWTLDHEPDVLARANEIDTQQAKEQRMDTDGGEDEHSRQ